jgi:hypothetical protein
LAGPACGQLVRATNSARRHVGVVRLTRDLLGELIVRPHGDVALAQILFALSESLVALAQVLVALPDSLVALAQVGVPLAHGLTALAQTGVALRRQPADLGSGAVEFDSKRSEAVCLTVRQ